MTRRYVLQLVCNDDVSPVPVYYYEGSSGYYVSVTVNLVHARQFDAPQDAVAEAGAGRRFAGRSTKKFFKSPKHTSKDPRYVAIPVDVSVTVSQ
jgi:hypothetical protein